MRVWFVSGVLIIMYMSHLMTATASFSKRQIQSDHKDVLRVITPPDGNMFLYDLKDN